MNLAVITSGFLPVPASQGGAVENLLENFIKKNEEYKKIKITVFSIKDKKAIEISRKYEHSEFIFIKPNIIVESIDKFTYFIAKNILKKDNTMSYRYIFQRLYFLNEVSRYLQKNTYDKVLLENHPTLFVALKKRKNYLKYKGRYYYHLHNEIKSSYKCEEIIKNCKNSICVSNFIKNQLSEFLNVKDKKNFSILRNCINQDQFNQVLSEDESKKIRKEYGIKDGDKVLLFTGRLTKEKGIKEILLSLKKVKSENYKLLVVGSFFFGTEVKNKFEEELEEIIVELKDKVKFTGFVPYEDIYKIYSISDIAILPSIWDDPAPLTVIESLSCGLPIITTNSGGIPEYVNEKCALIYNRDENLIENLSKGIEELIENDELRINMGKESLKASKELTLDNYYLNFIELLGVNNEKL